MYPHMDIEDCKTCASREMELNVKSNQSQESGKCRSQWSNFDIHVNV